MKDLPSTALCFNQTVRAITYKNEVYIAGQISGCYKFIKYNPATESITPLANFPSDYSNCLSMVLINDKIYAGIGGRNTNGTGADNSFFEYNISTNSWSQKASMPGYKRLLCSHFAIGNYAYVGMGCDTLWNRFYSDFYRYDPVLDQWSAIASPNDSLYATTCFSDGQFGYVTGGKRINSAYSDNAYKYDPQLNVWTTIAQVPKSKRYAASGAVVNQDLYVCMGLGDCTQNGCTGRGDLFKYNRLQDRWDSISTLPDPRCYDEGIGYALNGKLYFGLGDDGSQAPLPSMNMMMWEYSLPVSTTGILQRNNPRLKIVPSPACDKIKVSGETRLVRIKLMDAAGRIVHDQHLGATEVEIRINGLTEGIYILETITENGDAFYKKIVKAEF